MAFEEKHLRALVEVAQENNASDIHIREGEAPALRIRGGLVPVKSNKNLSAEDIQQLCKIMFKESDADVFDEIKDLDGVFEIKDICRLRYNFYRFNNKSAIVIRIVNMAVSTIDELNLSSTLKHIAKRKRGLVLVTGATGSGKSTTLAAMIDYINTKESRHIVTIEDPIEFIHPQKKSRISQREVGTDTENFQTGLKSALRQDPDVILLGELRDGESVGTAIKAAETGHLVLATLHTTDVVATISRILSLFTPEEQDDVRKRLADALFATVSQRMLKSKVSKTGIIIAQEIMVTSPGIKECIRGEEPLERIYIIIEKGGTNDLGIKCQSFDQHVFKLFKKGLIDETEAKKSVRSQNDFLQKQLIVE